MYATAALILATLLGATSVAVQDERAMSAGRPNIILIMSDDVGIGDVHCFGGHYHTPNIDKLAHEGTRFTNCYATPLCGPSRCQLLTGQYPFRTGLINNQSDDAVSPSRQIMIPTVLKNAGYVTASDGKWGQICLGPGQWGFDEYLVFPGSGRYWRDQTKSYTVNGKQMDLPEGKYLPDLMHQFAVDFISNHHEQPFFLYYPMSSIHVPIVPTPDSKPVQARSSSMRTTLNIWTSSWANSWMSWTVSICARRRSCYLAATMARPEWEYRRPRWTAER